MKSLSHRLGVVARFLVVDGQQISDTDWPESDPGAARTQKHVPGVLRSDRGSLRCTLARARVALAASLYECALRLLEPFRIQSGPARIARWGVMTAGYSLSAGQLIALGTSQPRDLHWRASQNRSFAGK